MSALFEYSGFLAWGLRVVYAYLWYVIWSVEIDTKLTEIKENEITCDAEWLVASFLVK